MPQLQLIAELSSHNEPAWNVVFNPTRNLLATCSTDKSIRLFSYILPSSNDTSTSPTTTTTTSSSSSGGLDLDLPSSSSSKPVFSLNKIIETEHKRTVRSICWSNDGKTLASGSFDSTVNIYEEVIPDDDDDVDSDQGEDDDQEQGEGIYKPKSQGIEGGNSLKKEWECVTSLEGHESECKSVAFSNDGSLLASCSRDKSVWVWEVQPDSDFECIAVMMEHTQDVKCIAWHPHEEILASASYDSHIHLAFDDPDSDWTIFQKLHPKLPLIPLTLSSSNSNSSKSLIDALIPSKEEKELQDKLIIPPLEEDETIWSLAFSPNGKYLACGGDLGGIRIFKKGGNQIDSQWIEIIHLGVHSRSIFSLSWSPSPLFSSSSSSQEDNVEEEEEDLGLLASTGSDGKIVIFHLKTTNTTKNGIDIKPIAAIKNAHGVNDINHLSWNIRKDDPKEKKGLGILSSVADDGSIKVWRLVNDD
ncbi:uncharacterized protein L201_001470 [Kwoniella dendrophila CBS 6074]|uniref:Probable cytosolic iron-sulfur protein assembly protein 1 n=1 Tax=Kwoniella dendrophila CBS 6074 TaxID=1295534 RepID=A0AAX4JQ52_9TREE